MSVEKYLALHAFVPRFEQAFEQLGAPRPSASAGFRESLLAKREVHVAQPPLPSVPRPRERERFDSQHLVADFSTAALGQRFDFSRPTIK